AHQRVPPAALPGLSGSWPNLWPGPPAALPPGPQVRGPDDNRPPPGSSAGLDGWLLDRLFGRR
ncbi:MAG TPA: hypothetical protein VEM36_04310, partial [Xanthobacteraceae bacterium]|nr:hypothetical protein [Xanthobacteraceae bacterium]